MTTTRKVEFDLEAVLLTALCMFLWLSLLSYDPADVGGSLPAPLNGLLKFDSAVYPLNPQPTNWCGWWGACASQLLVQGLGIGSLFVVTGLSILSIWMFRVQSNYVRASRQLGWLLVVIAATTLVTLTRIPAPLSPVIGSGGYLGAMAATWLNEHFALIGSIILTLTVLVAGLLLSTDYVFVRAATWMLLGGANMASAAATATRRKIVIPSGQSNPLVGTRKATSDVDQGVQIPGSETSPDAGAEPTVRIRGQQLENATTAVATDLAATATEGVLSTAKSIASSLLNVAKPALCPATEKAVDVDESSDAADAELEPIREVEMEDEIVQVRADEPQEIQGPRVKRRKAKDEKKAALDSLASLDDTRLPEGSEEYVLPGIDLLSESDDIDFESQTIEVKRKAKILEKTFQDFGFNVNVVEIETGPVIAQYEVELEAGLRLSKITGLADDLAIALRVPSVRIVAPIPGKNTVGIEVPNETRQVVRLREVIEEANGKSRRCENPALSRQGRHRQSSLVVDLPTLPHLLIAGRTGTGKSVCLNAIITSILMTKRPDEVRMLMIDPKMVELSGYRQLPHLMHPVVTDMKQSRSDSRLGPSTRWKSVTRCWPAPACVISQLQPARRRRADFERLEPEPRKSESIPLHLPFIVIVADEMADLMMTAGKEVEQHIIRLAQKSRAVGIHLILATQKPTVDVITGLIKSNLPARISFQVASRTDSRVVLDEMGADKLLGNGDMLFLWPGTSMLLRGQGTYVSDDEINPIVEHRAAQASRTSSTSW